MKQIYTSDITERNRDTTNYEQDNDWEDYDDDDLDEYPSRSVMRRVEIMKNRDGENLKKKERQYNWEN